MMCPFSWLLMAGSKAEIMKHMTKDHMLQMCQCYRLTERLKRLGAYSASFSSSPFDSYWRLQKPSIQHCLRMIGELLKWLLWIEAKLQLSPWTQLSRCRCVRKCRWQVLQQLDDEKCRAWTMKISLERFSRVGSSRSKCVLGSASEVRTYFTSQQTQREKLLL